MSIIKPFKVYDVLENVYPPYHNGEQFQVVEVRRTQNRKNYWYTVRRVPDGLEFMVLHKSGYGTTVESKQSDINALFTSPIDLLFS